MQGLEHFNLVDSFEYTSDEVDKTKDKKDDPENQEDKDKKDTPESTENEVDKNQENNQQNKPADDPVSDEDLFKLRDDKIKEIESKKEEERTEKEKEFLKEFKVEESPFSSVYKTLSDENILEIPKDKEYTKDLDGLKTLVTDNIKIGINSYKSNLPSKVQSMLSYLENGGTYEDYEQYLFEEDYSEVDVTDKSNQINLVKDYYSAQGLSAEDIQEKVQLFEENNKLEKEATIAKTYLSKLQKTKKETFEQQQAEQAKVIKQKRQEKLDNFKSKFEDIKDVAGFSVTKKEAQDLQDYMLNPVDKNKTQFQLDFEDDSNKIALAYFMKKKFNLDKVKKRAASEQATLLRKQLDELSKGVSTKKPGASTAKVPDQDSGKLEINVPSFMTYSTQD